MVCGDDLGLAQGLRKGVVGVWKSKNSAYLSTQSSLCSGAMPPRRSTLNLLLIVAALAATTSGFKEGEFKKVGPQTCPWELMAPDLVLGLPRSATILASADGTGASAGIALQWRLSRSR